MPNKSNQNEEFEKSDSIQLIKENLFNILNSSDETLSDYLSDYNKILIDLLSKENNFKKELNRALLANQEKISNKQFVLDKRPARPTASNWLKDFIKNYGSDLFDNLALSKFITYSDNAKRLDKQEREVLRKLLILYRNLKFFPESQRNVPVEKWEIIPVGILGSQDDNEVKRPKRKTKKEEYLELAKTYPEGSLERKAIMEEVKKLVY